ncbi:MAG TPA: hypothetical protein VIY48_00270, partial [Candidatus Paceibacterota bacterium]
DNLRLIAEYVFYDDAPGLLGIAKSTLTRYVKGTLNPSAENAERIAKAADKIRRREKRLQREAAKRVEDETRRTTEQFARDHGIAEPLPVRLPHLFTTHAETRNAAPVWVYDIRDFTLHEVYKLLRFFKKVLPFGGYSFTWEVKPGGTSPEGGKYVHHNNAVHIGHSRYFMFCQRNDPGAGYCRVVLDADLVASYQEYHDPSAKRFVTAVAISYPRLTEFTEEEKEEDRRRGADPLTGLVYVWQD